MSPVEVVWRGRRGEPTAFERPFAVALHARLPQLDYWLHEDPDGTQWLLVSCDFVIGTAVRDTLRLDVEQGRIAGGRSPACLNWDDGVRTEQAQIDLSPPEGICLHRVGVTPNDLAAAAAEWFARHFTEWPTSPRATR